MTQEIAPVPGADRIEILDVLRGIAVCGILAVNIAVMGTVGANQGRAFPASWSADWVAWCLERMLLEGAMRGLFTILFGAGMLMMLRKAEGERPDVVAIDVWTRRCLALLAFGVLQFALFMWPGEILWTYGVAGLALLAFRTARPRTLWIWALIVIACLSAFRAYDTGKYVALYQDARAGELAKQAGVEPSPEQQAGLDAVEAARSAAYPARETLAAETDQRTRLRTLLAWSAGGWAFRHLGMYSWLGVAESLGFMLIGMALYRSGFLVGNYATRSYAWVCAVGCGTGILMRAADMAWLARTGFEVDIHRLVMPVSLLRSASYEPARLALTLGYVALIILLFRSGLLGRASPLRALGRMALTTYFLQSLLTSLLFYGLGYVGAFGFASLMLVTAAIWVVTASFCGLWLKFLSFGPAEWLLRMVAYGSFGPKRRPMAAEVIARSPPI